MQNFDDFSNWVGRSEERIDFVNPNTLAAWNATLDRDEPFPASGAEVPDGFHWTLFPPLARQSELGIDGHPRKGGFLPPVPLPRRMWAGSRIEFKGRLLVGDAVTRVSRIQRVDTKTGRSGTLVFVTVKHELSAGGRPLIDEEQDLVYREPPRGAAPDAAGEPTPQGQWRREVVPTEAQLFRYSALTFNAHRIHYDHPYATREEGYPALVVHGPLIASLLLDHLRRSLPAGRLRRFVFRAIRPTYLGASFWLEAAPADSERHIRLWSSDAEGRLGMEAEAWLE